MQENYKYQNDVRLYLIIALMMILGAISKHKPSTQHLIEAQQQSGGVDAISLTTMYFGVVILVLAVLIQTFHFYIKSKKVSSGGHWQKYKQINMQPEVFDYSK